MNIYVGNLKYQITEEDLREIFEEYGDVKSVKIIIDRETGRSKGFAFVEMYEAEDGRAAMEELDGAALEGRPLRVNEAKRREDNRGGGGGRNNYNRGGGDRNFRR